MERKCRGHEYTLALANEKVAVSIETLGAALPIDDWPYFPIGIPLVWTCAKLTVVESGESIGEDQPAVIRIQQAFYDFAVRWALGWNGVSEPSHREEVQAWWKGAVAPRFTSLQMQWERVRRGWMIGGEWVQVWKVHAWSRTRRPPNY